MPAQNHTLAILAPHLPHLRCPETGQPLQLHGNSLVSPAGIRYAIDEQGKAHFVPPAQAKRAIASREPLDRLKCAVKEFMGPAYPRFVEIIAPVMPRIFWKTGHLSWKRKYLRDLKPNGIYLHLGSGNESLPGNIVNIDLFHFPAAHIMADCTKLPYAEESVDGIFSFAVLEHVQDPEAVLREAWRVLKPGGAIVSGVPFLQGYHGSPLDHWRWTTTGIQALHAKIGFENLRTEGIAGPTSSLLWVLQEWLAMVLSFGLAPLYYAWYLVLLVLTFPFKLLDLVLIYHPQAWKLSSFHVCEARKPAG